MAPQARSDSPVEVVFINPWGNMCDYYQTLSANLELSSQVVKLRVVLANLLKPLPLDKQKLDAHLAYQVLRRKGKLERGFPLPRLALALHKLLYKCQFAVLFHFAYSRFAQLKPKCVCVWNGHRLRERAAVAAAEQLGLPVLYFENGYLPNTTSVDPLGVNDACSLPRDPQFYVEFARANPHHQAYSPGALDVRQPIATKAASTAIHPQHKICGDYIFVPFQVDLDSQLLVNSPRFKCMREFYREVEVVARNNPQWQFVVKEHPSCSLAYQDLHQRQPNIIFTHNNTEQLIKGARLILTINSSVGMESLIFHKPVITLGKAFYNIPGMVLHAENAEQIAACIKLIYTGAWQPDSALIDAFIAFLQKRYLVDVAWRRADDQHFKAMSQRIKKYLEAPQQRIWE